jgi:hypothetical protein
MAISSLELPRIVLHTADPPSDSPPPYVGESDSDGLGFFVETASDEDWARYNWWITAQAETRRSNNGLVAQSEGESFTNADVFTLKFSTFITDNLINYVVKSLKNQLGLKDAPVAFFSSFFFTKFYRTGQMDPALRDNYCYEEVASWTRKTF